MNGKKMATIIIALMITVAIVCALSIYLFFKYYEPKKVDDSENVNEQATQFVQPLYHY